jgi:hypothetical protein
MNDFGASGASGPEPEFPDLKIVQAGTIPWTSDEFWTVMQHEMQLVDTPQDDWDRTPKRFAVDVGRGPEMYGFNPDIRANQVMSFIIARYREMDRTTVASHMNRYLSIQDFISVNRERLIDDQLMLREHEDGMGIAEALVDVLVEAPLDASYTNLGGHPTPTFHYERVVAEAHRRVQAEACGGDEGDA